MCWPSPPRSEQAAPADRDGARQLIFLAENRPVFVRLQVMSQGRPFDALWIESIRTIHGCLDRNGDGTLTTKEADPAILTAVVRLAVGTTETPNFAELDVQPKDGKVSVDELAEALRPILGPFRLQVARQAVGRTDALFDQLDRDKDTALTRPELAAIAGSLRPLDLDDDQMISALEIEPYDSPAFAIDVDGSSDRQGRVGVLPPVIELIALESTFRPARILMKKYDRGKGDVTGRPDNKLSSTEFAIAADAFAGADANGDDALDMDELRKLLARPPIDLTLDVSFSPEPASQATVRGQAARELTDAKKVRQLAAGDVEFAVGQVRLDIQVDDADAAADLARRGVQQQFKAADVNKDGYLEGKELAAINAPGSPFAGLSEVIDRNADGKVYLKEWLAFVDRQVEAAHARLLVATSDQGRAIFGIVDLDRDRRLGTREVMRTVDRVMSWDADGDGRVSAEEIPYHFQATIARGGLLGLTGESVASTAPRPMSGTRSVDSRGGPDWFEKMDRNHDGDVSRREFLGPREQFDRLDRDDDGLIDPEEAKAAAAPKPPR